MPRTTLDIPPAPKDLREYRAKIWTEVHLLRHDLHQVEMLEAEVGILKGEVRTAKTWTKAMGFFLGSVVAVMEYLRRFIG
jgi:hypothetical protein